MVYLNIVSSMTSVNPICKQKKTLEIVLSRIFSIFLLSITITPLFAQIETDIEYELKAYFIFTFTKYIEWIDLEEDSSFVIGIIGSSKIIPPLEKIAARNLVKDRQIIIKQWNRFEDIGKCSILFITVLNERDLARIINKVKRYSVLTIGDTKGFSKRGVAINFIDLGDRIGFEINTRAIDINRLKVSSHLQRLAVIIN